MCRPSSSHVQTLQEIKGEILRGEQRSLESFRQRNEERYEAIFAKWQRLKLFRQIQAKQSIPEARRQLVSIEAEMLLE